MFILYLALIFICAEKVFFLIPISNMKLLVDVGNLLIWIGLFDSLFRARDIKILNSPISVWILIYFVLVGVQVALSMIYYQQSIVGGLIGARNYFYYLSFFLFLIRLDDTKKMIKLLETLSVIGTILFGLAVINYFTKNIFQSQFAEGLGDRAGVRRAWFPGMMLLSFVLLWQYCRCMEKETFNKKSAGYTMLFMAAHFFRQTRTRTITSVFLMASLLMVKGKFKHSVLFVVIGAIAIGVAQVSMEENIITTGFETAIEDLSEDSGNWRARTDYAGSQLEDFMDHPLLGSGRSTLAGSESFRKGSKIGRVGKLLELSANVHTGYASWLSSYGFVGVVWLVCFLLTIFILGRRALRNASTVEKTLVTFALSYIGFVIITSISMNHLQFPDGILYVCLAAAIIVRILYNHDHGSEQKARDDANGTQF